VCERIAIENLTGLKLVSANVSSEKLGRENIAGKNFEEF
jgi:hypothetical protein